MTIINKDIKIPKNHANIWMPTQASKPSRRKYDKLVNIKYATNVSLYKILASIYLFS